MLVAAALLPFLSLCVSVSRVQAQAIHEPPDGQLYLSAWLDTSDDSPLAFNQRLGRNASWFQFSQNIPVDPLDQTTGTGGIINATQVFATSTDAGIYVTVYPSQGLAAIQPQDWAALGLQLQSYTALASRSVFLRFAPEMNGNWDIYGAQPTLFLSTWRTMHAAIKSACPTCALVWSPNASPGYPYSLAPSMVPNATDRAALDTNGDGTYDNTDDAYSPYYPGDEYVDWTGVSYYYKGVYPNSYNAVQQPGTLEAALTGLAPAGMDGAGPVQYTPFYETYCVRTPCMFSESGAAWHVNETDIPANFQSPTHLAVSQAWWRSGLTNTTFLTLYPRLKMLTLFEWAKVETDDNISTMRDFRLTNDSTVLSSFQEDLEGMEEGRYVWASYEAGVVGGGGEGQVFLPAPTPQRATPYRAGPLPVSLFGTSGAAALVASAVLAAVGGGIALGASLVL